MYDYFDDDEYYFDYDNADNVEFDDFEQDEQDALIWADVKAKFEQYYNSLVEGDCYD